MDDCRHEPCRCEAKASFDGYCSTHCQAAARRPENEHGSQCGCGHAPCGYQAP